MKIYEYEGLYYELMKNILYELKLITHHSKCYNCQLKSINNGHICPIHWNWWVDSVKHIKTNSICTNTTKIANGIWIWNDVVIPDWLLQLKKKLKYKK